MYIAVIDAYGTTGIKYSEKLDVGCSHTAEEVALFTALKMVSTMMISDEIIVYSDQITLVNIVKKQHITKRIKDKYPRINEIQDLMKGNKNISIKWIKSTKNVAHALVNSAYVGAFYNSGLEENKNLANVQQEDIITNFKSEIQKRDLIIKDLIKTITRLNKLTINQNFQVLGK